jgi:hypothetical protein
MTEPSTLQAIKQRAIKTLLVLIALIFGVSAIYLFVAYHFSYSKGESVGYVQKLSYKGWLCKTWEGEQLRAIVNLQTVPEKFLFTAKDDAVAEKLNQSLGQKVILMYEEHEGLPSCFGDTTHFVVDVQAAPTTAPPNSPAAASPVESAGKP